MPGHGRLESALRMVALSALVCWGIGCGATRNRITFTSISKRQPYVQDFSQAYVSRNGSSDCEVLAVVDEAEDPRPRARDGALHPQPSPPLKQIVHIRILWEPVHTKMDHPIRGNAAIDWYIVGMGEASRADLLHYSGVGLVDVEGSKSRAALVIREGKLDLRGQRGAIADHLGSMRISGTIYAKEDPQRIEEILADLHGRTK